MRLNLHSTFVFLSQAENGMLKKSGKGEGGGGELLNMIPLQG
jgi:hypothetical protein